MHYSSYEDAGHTHMVSVIQELTIKLVNGRIKGAP